MGKRAHLGRESSAKRCTFCGGTHHNRRDYQECRRRRGEPAPESEPVREKRKGSPVTLYLNDPLRGDKRAHAIRRKASHGWTVGKIAKAYGISREEVKSVLKKASS